MLNNYPKRLKNLFKKRCGLISTIPKSGTWYIQNFLYTYGQILKNPKGNANIEGLQLQNDKNKYNFKNLILFVGHTACPGYKDIIDDPLKQKWDKLSFWNFGFNWMENYLSDYLDRLNPSTCHKAKIVYVYRTPLDQFISAFNHCKNHKDKNHRLKVRNFKEYVFNVSALDSYIKHFHSFRYIGDLYSKQVLFISYEDLIKDPEKNFYNIISFLKIEGYKNKNVKNIIKDAVKSCSPDQVKILEKKLGRSLANDQKTNNTSHIRNNGSSYNKNSFDEMDIKKIKDKFMQFGYLLEKDILFSMPDKSTGSDI